MTTNQTIDGVPRYSHGKLCMVEDDRGEWINVNELRALLDAPAAPVTPCAIADALEASQWPNTSIGNKVLVAAAITELRKAAQPQDEPVAWEVTGGGVKPGLFTFKPGWAADDSAYTVRALVYAEQPAPVAGICCGSCPGGCVMGAKP